MIRLKDIKIDKKYLKHIWLFELNIDKRYEPVNYDINKHLILHLDYISKDIKICYFKSNNLKYYINIVYDNNLYGSIIFTDCYDISQDIIFYNNKINLYMVKSGYEEINIIKKICDKNRYDDRIFFVKTEKIKYITGYRLFENSIILYINNKKIIIDDNYRINIIDYIDIKIKKNLLAATKFDCIMFH